MKKFTIHFGCNELVYNLLLIYLPTVYTRISNFGPKISIRLILESTCTRVYTVNVYWIVDHSYYSMKYWRNWWHLWIKLRLALPLNSWIHKIYVRKNSHQTKPLGFKCSKIQILAVKIAFRAMPRCRFNLLVCYTCVVLNMCIGSKVFYRYYQLKKFTTLDQFSFSKSIE